MFGFKVIFLSIINLSVKAYSGVKSVEIYGTDDTILDPKSLRCSNSLRFGGFEGKGM